MFWILWRNSCTLKKRRRRWTPPSRARTARRRYHNALNLAAVLYFENMFWILWRKSLNGRESEAQVDTAFWGTDREAQVS